MALWPLFIRGWKQLSAYQFFFLWTTVFITNNKPINYPQHQF